MSLAPVFIAPVFHATVPLSADRPRRLERRRAIERRRARRRAAVVLVALTALVAADAPQFRAGLACEVPASDDAVIQRVELAPDGGVERIRDQRVDVEGRTCDDGAGDADELPVAVSVSHEADDRGSVEPAEFPRVEGAMTTRVRVRDTTAADRTVEVDGPLGVTEETRRIAVPQLVRIAISYPDGWDVAAPSGEGLTTRVSGRGVEVARTALLAAPFAAESVGLEVRATPGRGTPSVEVDATPVGGTERIVLPDELLDRDAAAVLGALVELAADGAGELADGAGQLADGTGELADGTRELAGNTDPLIDGSQGVADGSRELAGGARELAEGQRGLADGMAGIAEGADETAAGARELSDGAAELEVGLAELADGAEPLAEGAAGVAAGARQLADELEAAGTAGAALQAAVADARAIEQGLRELARNLRELGDDARGAPIGALLDLRDQLESEDPGDPAIAALDTSIALLRQAGEAPHALAVVADDLADGLGAALDAIAEVGAGLEALTNGSEELAAGAEEVADGVEELAAALGPIAAGAAGLAEGAAELTTALGGLADGADELEDGGRELADGGTQLAGGLGDLAGGADELAAGTREFGGAVDDLADGTEELADGTQELADGAGELPEALREAVGVADRSGQRAAATEAVLDAGHERARLAIGDAAFATTQLIHTGDEPLPLGLLASLGTGLALLGSLVGWWWRRVGGRR